MSIMIQVHHKEKFFGQCDAKCYNAKSKKCTCVCQGELHGLRRNEAIVRLRKLKPGFRRLYRSDDGFSISFI